MQGNREERIGEALRVAAAEFLLREANSQSLITVTRALISKDGGRATIFFTVFPETKEAEALSFATRHSGDFAQFLKTQVRGMRTPHIEFAIDTGEKNRQHLDDLSAQ